MISLFFWEYIYAIIGEDNIKYIELDDIDKYCDYIFEDLLPDWYFWPIDFILIKYENLW